jgi:EAL domain-containing protein (putative c-di-GMP-specific phosphodiesterase class I)
MVNITRDLALTTVAEGVENYDGFKLFFKLNTYWVQGDYFASPMDAKKC